MKIGYFGMLAVAAMLMFGAPNQSRGNGPSVAFTGRSLGGGGRGTVGRGSFVSPSYSYGGYGGFYPYGAAYPYAPYNYQVPGYSDLDTSNYDSTTWLSMEVQRTLARNGYYNGPVDGVVSTGTHVAISLFQQRNNLPVTGTINDRLLRALGLRNP
jgi:hypothetical protein